MAQYKNQYQNMSTEVSNQDGGKVDSKVQMIPGPANRGVLPTNPTKSGGIFRPTKGKAAKKAGQK